MKIKKRLWAILLSAAMILTFMPAAVFAESSPAENGVPDLGPQFDSTLLAADANEIGSDAVKPVSAEWTAPYELRGVIGTDEIFNMYTPDLASFELTYSDGSTKEFVCRRFEMKDEQGEIWDEWYSFMVEGGDEDELTSFIYPLVDDDWENPIRFKEGINQVPLVIFVPYEITDEETGETDYDLFEVNTEVQVNCYADQIPTAVEFIPAEDFTAKCFAGYNWVSEYNFYGDGNAFRVTYEGYDEETGGKSEFTRTYYYAKDKTSSGEEEEGFFYKGNVNLMRFEFEGNDFNFEIGTHNIDFVYEEYITELDETVSVPFTVSITADRYDAYSSIPICTYTGKVVKPKFVIYNSYDDSVIPSSAYTIATVKNKKMGWYETTVTFKDKTKYTDSIQAYYGIGPAAPKLKSLTAGKKKLTVKWKKLTKKQLKNIDGFYIEIATDKDFIYNYKSIHVKKSQVKKGYKVIKNLKKGKKYYVRINAYKNIKDSDGDKYEMPSEYSKVKSKKTK